MIKNVIRCPYHSWSYDFNGKLSVTPHIGGLGKHDVEGFDKNNSNLKEIKSKVWMDLIFININSNAKPFEEFIKPLEDRWSKFISKKDQQLIRHSTDNGYFNMIVNSNWKFAIENYCESYHLPWIHPELNRVSKKYYSESGLSDELSKDNSFTAQIRKATRMINADKDEDCKSNQPDKDTRSAIVQLAKACNDWCGHLRFLQEDKATPEQQQKRKSA